MAITITLPNINGTLEAGLAVGTDPSLAEAVRLPVWETATTANATKDAAQWVYEKFKNTPEAVLRTYINAAVICVQGGLCRKVGTSNDGDWKGTTASACTEFNTTAEEAARISGYISNDNVQKALTLIVATKANWWLTNHTGQNEVVGYTKKVLTIQFGMQLTSDIVTMAHTIGHWASTINVLRMANIRGLRNVLDASPNAAITITLSEDAKMRFNSMPTATHRLVVAYESAKRLTRSPVVKLCPGASDFASIVPMRAGVLESLSKHHIGASYLTGTARADYSDSDCDAYLGHLGTYIRKMFGRSTLAQSPHLAQSKVESYEDYSPEWKQALTQFRIAATQNRAQATALINESASIMSDEALNTLRQAFR